MRTADLRLHLRREPGSGCRSGGGALARAARVVGFLAAAGAPLVAAACSGSSGPAGPPTPPAPATPPVAGPPASLPIAPGDDPVLNGSSRLGDDEREGVLRDLREARRRHPDDAQVAFSLARALHADTKLGEAEAAYRAAVALQPDLGEAWLRLSEILVEQGRLTAALDALAALEKARGGGPNLDYQVGFVLSKMGRFKGAERLLQRSLAARPGNPDAWYVLGLNAQRQGRNEEAARAFSEALRRDPGYADAWFNLGNALARLGRTDEAGQALARFASVNEAREKARARAARLHSLRKGAEIALESGDLEATRRQIDEAAAAVPGLPWVARLRGHVLLAGDRREEALVALRQAAALNSPEPAEHMALALAFRQAGDEASARREEREARRLLSEGGNR